MKIKIDSMGRTMFVAGALALTAASFAQKGQDGTRVEVVFSGGHETDRTDRGRPVVLIAAALGVRTEVFREAFSHVTPSRGGPPSGDLARRNKAALLDALGRYGITNERLDEVSNFYRYRPQDGEIWPNKPAKAYAIVSKGKIVRFEIAEAGSGYCSAPTVTIPGFSRVQAKVGLGFDKRFEKNGGVKSISLG